MLRLHRKCTSTKRKILIAIRILRFVNMHFGCSLTCCSPAFSPKCDGVVLRTHAKITARSMARGEIV